MLKQRSGVYALLDPVTNRVMYVGQAVDIDRRFSQHCLNRFDGNMQKHEWVNSLKRRGAAPVLNVLKYCDWPDSDQAEKDSIRSFKAIGQCELNIAAGGSARAANRVLNSCQDDWVSLGRKIKSVRQLLMEIQSDVVKIAKVKSSDDVRKLVTQLDRIKWRLETEVINVFPEWQDAIRIFSGAEEASDIG